jgi:roadblock/LC7 domain-containing protein
LVQILQPGDYTVLPPPSPVTTIVTKVVFAGLQTGSFQTLWGVGRSKPISNPPTHGTVTQTVGNPLATYDFHPVALAGESDNLYCLRRLITQVDSSLLANAKNFSNSAWIQIDNPSNCQAFEFDLPTPLNVGTMGIQLLPGRLGWSVRAFDYTVSSWRPLNGTNFDPSLLVKGAVFGGEYTCDGKTVEHTAVLINGTRIPVTYSQSCGATLAPRFNAAFQLDATGDAKAYKVSLNNFTVTLQ